ncbi:MULTISPECIES: hypothetical protein [unclassified Nocardioides]|uniref:hypothetical protein n=1 Tax=unclassified Nocardioides TaxID=2615069 RepID=UPI0006FD6BDA|nr:MULTISPECIES: hypothetical protein [unclassified Nocardioides]KRA27253.1 hypothetical protein ASD81_24495 [Nocardioides sp. Root614]KRA91129.1 hypothetical protein ASD84_00195 [Nocardioides sp. Root682]
MSRRVSLPTADDLFRPTAGEEGTRPGRGKVRAVPDAPQSIGTTDEAPQKAPSGRVRHDEKITVYVTATELMDLEKARLTLRGEHGLAVDRGRIVREALHLVLAELESGGEDSALVRRLRES